MAKDNTEKPDNSERPAKKGGVSDAEKHLWLEAMREAKPLRKPAVIRQEAELEGNGQSDAAKAKKPKTAQPKAKAGTSRVKPASPPQPRTPASQIELSHGRSAGLDRRQADRLKRGRLPIDGRIDLHGMTQARAQVALQRFISDAAMDGKRCLLVITGKGRENPEGGILRQAVPRWLNQPGLREKIVSFDYAQQKDGGTGALYVLLRRRRD